MQASEDARTLLMVFLGGHSLSQEASQLFLDAALF